MSTLLPIALDRNAPQQLSSSSYGSRDRDSVTIVDRTSRDLRRHLPEEDDDDVNSAVHAEAYGAQPGEKGWDAFEVIFAPDDPESPFNWSRPKRWYMTIMSGILVLNATFASSAPSGFLRDLEQYFTFSSEIGSLLIALFVGGYCVGPLLWAPLSEQYGRRPIFLITFIIYTGFQVGCALSRNTASILVFRFLGGVFASAPLTNSGGVMSDMWDSNTRGKALALFTIAPFAGPTLAPLCSGFMAASGVSWRWIFWLLTLFAGACLFLIFFTMPETYTPILLVHKARRLRKETGDDRYWAPLEKQDVGIFYRLSTILGRPFKILAMEPMLIAITLYMSFVYGCIYILFESYPIVFSEGHHMNAGITGLMFLPIFVGAVIGVIIYMIVWNPRYAAAGVKFAPASVPPEYRLEQCLWAAPIFAASFFWFGWTSYSSVSYWAPMMSGLPMGIAITWIFLSLINYIVDAYLFVAASALASMTVVRSLFGAGFPLFASQMYNTLNPRWASTLLGLLAILMGPIPFILRRYGHVLRKKSKYAPSKPVPNTDTEAQAEAKPTIIEPKKTEADDVSVSA
ncbi:MFS general substrate transporter [Abortiporus biennis]|nr:MFS general substrate transporter [Abortiporus biennis]